MDGPISVRLQTPDRDEMLGEKCRGLSFRKVARGGYASGSLRLIGGWSDWNIGPMSRVWAYNARTGSVLWEGYTDNPGQTFDTGGESFEIGVQGAMTKASDVAESLLYLDASMEHWRSDDRNDQNLAPSGTASVSAWPDTEQDALLLQFASGTPISKGDEVRMVHDLAASAPMGVAGYSFKVKSGINTNGYECRVSLGTNGVVEAIDMQTSSQFMAGLLGVNIGVPGDVLKIRLRRMAGATNVGTDRIWAGFADPFVVGRRLNLDGTDQLSIASDFPVITAPEIVRDLVYRMMPGIDKSMSLVENIDTPYEIDQFCYADSTRATGVLEDLELFEPSIVWQVGASSLGGVGGHSFTFREWPAFPRYELSVDDGYEAPGGEVDLCNRIAVGWVDRKGREKTTIVVADVPELGGFPDDGGATTRDAEKITLDESVSSLTNAQRIGEQVLELKNHPPKAATATLARPIWDADAGRMVAPWEVEPGYLARVREVGDEVRVTEVEVDTVDLTASVTLGEPAPTQEQLIARLTKTKRRRS